jgi:hypothetical protein
MSCVEYGFGLGPVQDLITMRSRLRTRAFTFSVAPVCTLPTSTALRQQRLTTFKLLANYFSPLPLPLSVITIYVMMEDIHGKASGRAFSKSSSECLWLARRIWVTSTFNYVNQEVNINFKVQSSPFLVALECERTRIVGLIQNIAIKPPFTCVLWGRE